MTRQIDTIPSLIRAAGGDAALAALCGLRPGATKKWAQSGVPEKHWSAITAATGITVDALHALNERARMTGFERVYRRNRKEPVNGRGEPA
mgnify:CR=1 FL=1